MNLIKSISGIRGIVGGKINKGFTPFDILCLSSSYGSWIMKHHKNKKTPNIVIGRDSRIYGKIASDIIISCLRSLGINVFDAKLSSTPTIQNSIIINDLDGGIVITASHNPEFWNGIKFLNKKGEFISQKELNAILKISYKEFCYVKNNKLGCYKNSNKQFTNQHINSILDLDLVKINNIKKKKFKIVVDGINSVGGIIVPLLLEKFHIDVIKLNCIPNGLFSHNPEPLIENIVEAQKKVIETNADLGIVVDPDVDRLALICNDGSFFGEEYTIVSIADYILDTQYVNQACNIVSNICSSTALQDLVELKGGKYFVSKVGEIHVVKTMKRVNAIFGGEGNGGIIYPKLHYGRDSLVAIALFLSKLSIFNGDVVDLKKTYPFYFMIKKKIPYNNKYSINHIYKTFVKKFPNKRKILIDGIKIYLTKNEWIYLRKSQTESVIRIYCESYSKKRCKNIINSLYSIIKKSLQ